MKTNTYLESIIILQEVQVISERRLPCQYGQYYLYKIELTVAATLEWEGQTHV